MLFRSRHLLALPISYFQSRRTGEVVARVRELDTLREFITSSALTLVIDLLFTMIFLVVMWFYSPKLTGIVLLTLPCYVLIAVFVTPILRKRVEERFKHGAENQSFLVESVSGAETIKAMSVQPQSQERWESLLAAYVRSSFRASNLGNIAGQAVQLVSKMGSAAILFFGASLVIGNQLTVGQLIAFNMFAGYVTAPVLRLSQLWNDFQQARLAVERLGDILNSPTEPGYNPGRSTIGSIDGELTFDQVTFRYRPDKPETLRRLSFKVEAGQTIGIVGPSGSGKTTLLKAILGSISPVEGHVTKKPQLRMGYVPQVETVDWNFPVTVLEVVVMTRSSTGRLPRVTKDERADALLVLERLGLGGLENRHIRELSGGQQQRVFVARALFHRPELLVLDEPTSGVDVRTRHEVLHLLADLHDEGVSIILSTHDLNGLAAHLPRLVCLNSEIIADGSPVEVLTPEVLEQTFGAPMEVLIHGGMPVVVDGVGADIAERMSRLG